MKCRKQFAALLRFKVLYCTVLYYSIIQIVTNDVLNLQTVSEGLIPIHMGREIRPRARRVIFLATNAFLANQIALLLQFKVLYDTEREQVQL